MRRTAALPALLSVPLLLGAVGGCAPGAERTAVERTDSAGVEIVVSPGADEPLPWRLEPAFTVGGEGEGPESFHTVTARTLAAGAEGELYVVDHQSHRVVAFDSTGAVLRVMGGEGDGPGEMRMPMSIAVAPGGTVEVFALGRRGLMRYAADGAVLPEVRWEGFPIPGSSVHHYALLDAGRVVAGSAGRPSPDSIAYELTLEGAADTTTLARMVLGNGNAARYDCGIILRQQPLFEPSLVWHAEAGRVAVSTSAEYSIALHDLVGSAGRGDGPTRRVRRSLPVREATRAMAATEIGDGISVGVAGTRCDIPADEVVGKRGFEPTVPWIRRVTLAPDSTLWVTRFEPGSRNSGAVDVFAADGAYLGTLPEGSPSPVIFLGPDRFAAIETDDFDVSRVTVYEVVR